MNYLVKVFRVSALHGQGMDEFAGFFVGALAEEVRLEIEVAPFDFRCRSCGGRSFREAPARGAAARGSKDLELVGRMDLAVQKIEVGIPDSWGRRGRLGGSGPLDMAFGVWYKRYLLF